MPGLEVRFLRVPAFGGALEEGLGEASMLLGGPPVCPHQPPLFPWNLWNLRTTGGDPTSHPKSA